ncbi:MAG TPA: hypothetical protein DCQ31_10115 [Bacteroidales bacterium]|nr:hypothetical protein [Bacteroidales bacterium]
MKLKQTLLAVLLLFAVMLQAQAQDEKSSSDLNIGTAIVSSYVWRGMQFNAAPNIQPYIDFNYKGFGVGAWASVNFDGSYVEPDFYLYYKANALTVTLYDYHNGGGLDYLNFETETTKHLVELSAVYTISESFPLSLTASAFIYGEDKKISGYDLLSKPILDPAKNNYSSYFELSYNIPHPMASVDLSLGFVAAESNFYGTEGFGLINAGIKVSKEIKITESFSLPVFSQFVVNPTAEAAYFAFGLSF